MIRSLSIRWRLTLWYGAAMTTVMLVFSAAIFVLTARSQSARIDFELDEEMNEVVYEVTALTNRDDLLKELKAEFGSHATFDFDIAGADGSALFLSDRLKQQRLFDGTVWPTQSRSDVRILPDMGELRVLRHSLESPHGPLLLHVAIPLSSLREAQRSLLQTMSVVGPVMLLLAISGGYWLARRALAPVAQMTAAAKRITALRLDQRLDIPPVRDELSHLARTLNDMIDRLHHSFDEMRRFTADAAHELRTPLTVLRTQLEIALRSDRSNEQYREVLVSLHEDTVRMCHLAAQLLELAREDTGTEAAPFTTLRLDEILQDAVDQVRPAAAHKSLRFEMSDLPPTQVDGDAPRLQRVFVNLLDNAVKHTPPGGRICMSLTKNGHSAPNGSVEVNITDNGGGIPAEHLPHLFNRFYRVHPASTTSDGSGLGLAISQAIVQAHRGHIALNSTLGYGTTATVTLPAA